MYVDIIKGIFCLETVAHSQSTCKPKCSVFVIHLPLTSPYQILFQKKKDFSFSCGLI